MRVPVAAAMLGTVLVASASSQISNRPSDSLERPFVQNGRLRIGLGAGDYVITGSQENRIPYTKGL